MRYGLAAAGLLVVSNTFMTAAWYGHLRFPRAPLWAAVLARWALALFEYCAQVPANRLGYRALSGYQLKVMQEAITLLVFIAFARLWLGEAPTLRHFASFLLILGAVAVAFA